MDSEPVEISDMLKPRILILFFFSLAAITGCEDGKQPESTTSETSTATESPSAPSVPAAEEIDTNRYIRAATLRERLENESGHFVFDVRNRDSYKQSHVQNALSMPYGQVEPEQVAALDNMTLDTAIVTYCGCPHHLAGLAADQLIEWGYRNVRVLYEGFWYWRDNQYPLAGLQIEQTSELQFAGVIRSDNRPLPETDVFIRNLRNGQLEAAATDANGRFETGFHVLDYQSDDVFEIRVGALTAPVVHRVNSGHLTENEVRVHISIKTEG